ncbi:hypothetical protein OSTOST_11831, partial [Ostertagia ostertagi]
NYDCDLEKQAASLLSCHTKTRKGFSDVNINYGYVTARRTYGVADALFVAAIGWWGTHKYNHQLKGVTPQKGDYPILPFLMMANAQTETVGCAVKRCPGGRYGVFSVVCVYGKPSVATGNPLQTRHTMFSVSLRLYVLQ